MLAVLLWAPGVSGQHLPPRLVWRGTITTTQGLTGTLTTRTRLHDGAIWTPTIVDAAELDEAIAYLRRFYGDLEACIEWRAVD